MFWLDFQAINEGFIPHPTNWSLKKLVSRVGTVEGRSTALSMVAIQPELKRRPHAIFQGTALQVDPQRKKVTCKDDAGCKFDLDYDLLFIATGSQVWIAHWHLAPIIGRIRYITSGKLLSN